MEPSARLDYHDRNAYKDRLINVHSPTSKLAFALILSIAVHSVVFLLDEAPEPYLSKHTIIHARLDHQDRELLQQEQTGQITQQHNEVISEASDSYQESQHQPVKQETTKAEDQLQDKEVLSSQNLNDEKTLAEPVEAPPENTTADTVIEELIEKTEVTATQSQAQQTNQINSDSRAQVKASKGSEDPTYTSYRRVLKQYLEQRLEASPDLKGRVRLKIKLEYGSFATSVTIIKSSGDLNVDNWVKKAALAANPYPKIPKEIGSTFEYSPTFQLGKP